MTITSSNISARQSAAAQVLSPEFHVIIPARYQSTRLPGKPLMDIKGKTLIERVYERALMCGARSVTIATDDDRIEDTARSFGAHVCRTKDSHLNGTDRLAEAVCHLKLGKDDIVVNLQGDEPLVPPEAVAKVALALQQNHRAFMTTLCCPITNSYDLHNPNVVKIVLDKNRFALYFSRSLIPYPRDTKVPSEVYRHIGLYAYRVSSLLAYQNFPPATIETIEQLEPLRILWQGEHIQVTVVNEPLPPGVDTLADLEHMRQFF